MNYRPEIDGLRALAIVPVVLFHAGIPGFSGGYIGVDVFFVISGYLITSIILNDLSSDQFSIKRFYERRARRILPALFTVMFACIPFAWILLAPDDLRSFANSIVSTSLFSSNIQFWLESGYFDNETELKPLLHTWSLAVEEQYYVFFPLLLLCIWKADKRIIRLILGMIFVTSFILAEHLSKTAEDANFYLLPSRAWELMAGALIAHTEFRKGPPRKSRLGDFLSFTGIVLILLSSFLFTNGTRHPSVYTLLPVLGTMMVIKHGRSGNLAQTLLANKLLVGIGLISYSLYLWHQPVIAFAKIYYPFNIELTTRIGLIALATGLAYCSWKYIEQPFRNSQQVSRRRIFQLSAAAIPLACIIGFTLILAEQNIERFDKRTNDFLAQIKKSYEEENHEFARKCNYDRLSDVDEFLDNWDCLPADKNGLMIVGNSHAMDKAWALRMAGFDNFGQMTGSGCSVGRFRARRTIEQCKRIFDKVIELAREGRIGRIAISFQETGLAETVQHIVNYWEQAGVPIMIFGTMPQFKYFKRQLLSQRFLPEGQSSRWYYELGPNTDLENTGIQAPHVTYLDIADIICGEDDLSDCKPVRGDITLLVDHDHLSISGAKLIGHQIINDPTWIEWLDAPED